MPKVLVPYGWAEKPCVFRQRVSDVCQLCERPFTMLNGGRHCAYCGKVFHRKDCSTKTGLLGQRTCTYCDDYRTVVRDKMSKGEVFVCVSKGLDVSLSYCEHTAELILHWKKLGLKETVDLLKVDLRKGFTHCGHLHTGGYEPLKSMSLVIKGSTVLDLKASSAWICQLWVDGFKSAQYMYKCMLEQETTRLSYLDKGVKVQPSWFTTYYLIDSSDQSITDHTTDTLTSSPLPAHTNRLSPAHTPSPLTVHSFTSSQPTSSARIGTPSPRKDFHRSTSHSLHNSSRPHLDNMLSFRSRPLASIDSGYNSDMSYRTRPWEVKGHRIGSPVWTSSGSLMNSPPQLMHSHIQHRLPYRSSQLSELCRCHDYEILPSRSVDVGTLTPPTRVDTVRNNSCCVECMDTCRIAKDLDNL